MAVRLEHRASCSHLNVSIKIFASSLHLRFPEAVPSRVQHWAELELTWQKVWKMPPTVKNQPRQNQTFLTNPAVISFFFAPFLFCFLVVLWCQFAQARTLTRLQSFTSVRNAKQSLGETFCVLIKTHWATSSQNMKLNSWKNVLAFALKTQQILIFLSCVSNNNCADQLHSLEMGSR